MALITTAMQAIGLWKSDSKLLREDKMIVLKVDMLVKPGTEKSAASTSTSCKSIRAKNRDACCTSGHQSTEDPRKFLFYEQYKDAAALAAHRGAPYFKQYVMKAWTRSWRAAAATCTTVD